MADPFVAEIRIFPFNFAPKGWAWCDGQLLPLSQNTALFSLLGTTYGGDGKSTFALPNMQDNAPMQPGQGQGRQNRTEVTAARHGQSPCAGAAHVRHPRPTRGDQHQHTAERRHHQPMETAPR